MSLNFSKFYTKTNIINLLFFLIPASFIAGNLVLNLNILLLILTGLSCYKYDIFKIQLCFLDKLLLIFFTYIFVISCYNNLYSYYFENKNEFIIIIKTLLYFRYLLLYFVIRYLVIKNVINFKFFFISCSLCSLFICLDLVYQYNYGVDIFGFEASSSRRMSGPFGDELIAGSYLQRFAIFSFFLFPIFFKIKDKKFFYIIFFVLSLLLSFSLIIAGNRMPIILFLLMLTLLFLFEKKTRKLLVFFTIISSVIFLISINFNTNIKKHFGHFKTRIIHLATTFSETNLVTEEQRKNFTDQDDSAYLITVGDKSYRMTSPHLKDFYSGYTTWHQNKLIGGGVRSFKYNCPKTFVNCSSHPHNYYLEILSDIGLVGLFILLILFLKIFYDVLRKKYLIKSDLNHNHIITPFMCIFLAEIFPIKSSGSFFTTNNATFIFLIIAIIVSITRKPNLN